MSTSAAFTFPLGRIHATPWGRHVNEAEVEWPPSPWRLLRALYATWQARAPHLPAETVETLLADLSAPPTYTLPPTSMGHTRHYMPDAAVAIKSAWAEGTDKVIDSFLLIDPQTPLGVTWSVDLGQVGRGALSELLGLLPYLGRADSVCCGRLLVDGDSVDGMTTAPVSASAVTEFGGDVVRLLAARAPLDMSGLAVRTTDVRRAGYLDPPASCRVPYARPRSQRHQSPTLVREPNRHQAAYLVLDSPARPSIRLAVAVADAARSAVMKQYDEQRETVPWELSGHMADGQPAKGHRHAHWLAVPEPGGGRLIDGVLLWAPGADLPSGEAAGGLSEDIVARLGRIRQVRAYGLRPARVVFAGAGRPAELAPSLASASTVWTSLTPFAPPRHSDHRMSRHEKLAEQVHEEAARRGLPAVVSIEPVDGPWLAFRRYRAAEKLSDGRRAAGVRVEFAAPVGGPLTLGALSHFGLGLFQPADIPL